MKLTIVSHHYVDGQHQRTLVRDGNGTLYRRITRLVNEHGDPQPVLRTPCWQFQLTTVLREWTTIHDEREVQKLERAYTEAVGVAPTDSWDVRVELDRKNQKLYIKSDVLDFAECYLPGSRAPSMTEFFMNKLVTPYVEMLESQRPYKLKPVS